MMITFQCLIGILLIANNLAVKISEEADFDFCEILTDNSIECDMFYIQSNGQDQLTIECKPEAELSEIIHVFPNYIQVENIDKIQISLKHCQISEDVALDHLPLFIYSDSAQRVPVWLNIFDTDFIHISENNNLKKVEALESLIISHVKDLTIDWKGFKDNANLNLIMIMENKMVNLKRSLLSVNGDLHLEAMKIFSNDELKIDYKFFHSMPNLKTLHINNNNLEEIHKTQFMGLPNLIQLNLSNNKLQKFDVYSFIGLSSLQDLNVGGNHLKKTELVEIPQEEYIRRLIPHKLEKLEI